MKRLRWRWSRGRVAVNVPLFTLGLALILGSAFGLEVSGVKAAVVEPWWIRAILAALGVAVVALSFHAVQPSAGPAAEPARRPAEPLPPLVPGTVFVGYVPDVPARYIPRPGLAEAVRGAVLAHGAVGLVGMGGAGKTTLAAATAHNPDLRSRFSDGIVWVDVGRDATAVVLQERLTARLTGESVSFATVEAGRNRLAELLAGRKVLLVVDDVWDVEALRAVDVTGGQTGALVFTTRDRGIARAVGAAVHEVDELTLDQSLSLLGRWTDVAFEQLPAVADPLCLRVGNLALGVALVGAMIKARGARPQDWRDVLDLLEHTDITTLSDAYGPDNYQHAGVLASITLSIHELTTAEQERYRELAVFAGRGSVPTAAVNALWAQAGYQATDVGRLLARLTDRCLVQRDARAWFTLHDLQYDVAAHQLATGPDVLAHAHGRLLDGYSPHPPQAAPTSGAGGQDDPPRWTQCPDDGYLIQNLAYHLARAQRGEQLDELLVTFAWLERRLTATGISDLLTDYSHHQPRPAAVDVVHDALQLSAHILADQPRQLAGQLTGRLLNHSDPAIRTLLDTAHPSDEHPWLCPMTPGIITEPGGPLERTLTGPVGPLEHSLPSHTGWVTAVAVTPDGQRIITGSGDNLVRIWNLADGRLERTLSGHTERVTTVAVTPDGWRVVSGSFDQTVRVWNLASGRLERTLRGHTHWVTAMTVTPNGRGIVSGGHDKTVRVWNLADGQLERTLNGHTTDVTAVAVTPDGQRIITGSDDRIVRIWNLADGQLEDTLQRHAHSVDAVAVTPDGRHIISGSDSNHGVRVWDLSEGRVERTLEGHTSDMSAVVLTPDGKRVVSAGRDHTVRVWCLADGRLERTLRGHTDSVQAVAVTPDGQRVISAGADRTVRVWNLADERIERERIPQGHTDSVEAVAFTPDGERIISGGRDRTVRVWNLASGRLERTLPAQAESVNTVAVTPDGRYLVCGTHEVLLWDLAEERFEHTTGGPFQSVEAVAVTPDGKRIVSGGWGDAVCVQNLGNRQRERALKGHTAYVDAVAISPNGRRVVSGSRDKTIRVWTLTGGRLERTLEGHTDSVNAVAVTPDGRHIVSGSYDKTVRLWDLAGGTELARWTTDATVVYSCASHPADPTILVYGDKAGQVVVLSIRKPGPR